MNVQRFLDSVQTLTDLELAVFLSLVARENCLLSTSDDLIDDLAHELALIVSERFFLSYVLLESSQLVNVDDFSELILEDRSEKHIDREDSDPPDPLHTDLQSVDIRAENGSTTRDSMFDDRTVVNVIIAKEFNFAHEHVQVQLIEMIQNRRITRRTGIHPVPNTFLFLPIIQSSTKHIRLTPHLNDRIFISHFHDPQDGFPNLEELDQPRLVNGSSRSSVDKRITWAGNDDDSRRIQKAVIDAFRSMAENVAMTPEVRRYLQDIVTFLRIERGVDGGVSPRATVQFIALTKYLASLHGIDFVTPSLVALAARKIYPHRIVIAAPARERSMLYGSDINAITQMLQGVTPETVIESVLNTVPCPR